MTISVRTFLSVVLSTAVIIILSACGSSNNSSTQGVSAEQQTFKWKLVTTWPKNFPGLGIAPEEFASLVNRMSNGRLKVKVYAAGEIVPALEVFSAVSSGTAEMGHGAAYYWKGKIPAAPFFTSVPFGLNAQEMNGWLHHGGGLELWRELYAPFNLVPMAGGNTGIQMGGWFNKELNSIDDFKGLKMRIPGLGGEVFTRAGGTAVNMPGGEIFTSLQTGVIDAAEWVAPYNDLAFGFHNVAKYYYYPGWQEPGPTLELMINKSAYESMQDDLAAIVVAAARTINKDMLDKYTSRNNAALIELEKSGVELRRYPDEVIKRLRETAQQVMAENVENDAMFKKIYTSYDAYRQQVIAYHKISEEAYFDIRNDQGGASN
jgi:TRAP-type mannitol/chloroaromatic compound transport system substrate-binding protein